MQKKLGDILVDQGKITQEQVGGVLEKQATRKSESVKKSVATNIRVDLKKLDH